MAYSGRLDQELLERAAEFGARVLNVVSELERQKRTRRVIDQTAGSGGGAGALLWEANEAVSKADFVKTLGWAAKELSEVCYWLAVIAKASWLPAKRLGPLQEEALQLLRTTKTLIARCRL